MANLQKIKFSNLYLCHSRNGVSKPSRIRGSGYLMVNMGEIFKYNRIDDSIKMEFVPLNENEKRDSFLQNKDLLFARQSLVIEGAGKCSIYLGNSNETTFESHLIRIRLNQKLAEPLYYYYYFSSIPGKQKIRSIVNQVAAAGIRSSELGELLIDYPDLTYQVLVTSILEKYDKLIENNEKRIKILQEMSQLLYYEWFIKFHFPGHKEIKSIDDTNNKTSLWKEVVLGDKLNILKGKNITKDTISEGVVPVIAGGLKPAYYHSVANTVSPVVTISASGANAGFVNLYQENIWASDCSYIDKNQTQYVYFYYLYLKNNQELISGLQRGAAQPHVYPKDLMRLPIYDIPESILNAFESKARTIFESIGSLKRCNQNLAKTRDLLIPQLVTGKRELK